MYAWISSRFPVSRGSFPVSEHQQEPLLTGNFPDIISSEFEQSVFLKVFIKLQENCDLQGADNVVGKNMKSSLHIKFFEISITIILGILITTQGFFFWDTFQAVKLS